MNKHSFLSLFLACTALFFTACDDDNNEEPTKTTCKLQSFTNRVIDGEDYDHTENATLTYNEKGQLTTVVYEEENEETGTISFHYTDDLLTSVVHEDTGEYPETISTKFTYDDQKRVTTITYKSVTPNYNTYADTLDLKYEGNDLLPSSGREYADLSNYDKTYAFDQNGNLTYYKSINTYDGTPDYTYTLTNEYNDKASPIRGLFENAFINYYVAEYFLDFQFAGFQNNVSKSIVTEEDYYSENIYEYGYNEEGMVISSYLEWSEYSNDSYTFQYDCE